MLKLIDLNLFLKAYVAVNIVGDKENSVVKKCTEILDKYGCSYTFSQELDRNKINVYFFDLNNSIVSMSSEVLLIIKSYTRSKRFC